MLKGVESLLLYFTSDELQVLSAGFPPLQTSEFIFKLIPCFSQFPDDVRIRRQDVHQKAGLQRYRAYIWLK